MSFKTRRNNERGIAMLIAMLAVMLLAIIGLGFMFMSSSENSVNNNFKDSQKSYFASRAGLENVRLMLVPPDPRTGLGAGPLYASAMALTMPTIAANTGVLYVENKVSAAENIDPTTASGVSVALNPNLDNEICKEQFLGLAAFGATPAAGAPCDSTAAFPNVNTYFQVPAVVANQFSNTNGALPFKWVRLTNKQNLMGTLGARVDAAQADNGQVCWDGNKQYVIPPLGPACAATPSPSGTTTSMMPVWELTSLSVTPAVGSNPGSRRITQMEVALAPPLIPNAPIATDAPVTFVGSYVVNAYDFCTCQCTTPKNGPTTCGGVGCYNQAVAVETGGTVSINGASGQTIANPVLPSPYMQNVDPWPFDINDLINTYKQGATVPPFSCSGTPNFSGLPPVYANCGTQTGQQFGGYPASLLGNPPVEPSPTGYNPVTTYIPGSVKLTADANGAGILVIDGDLEINGGLNYYGLILVRGKVSFTGGGSQAVNLYGSILAGEDVTATDTAVSDKFGGSINFHYDVCALKRSGGTQPPRLLATHEITF